VSRESNERRTSPRGAATLAGLSVLAVLWFSFVFFAVFPAAILWWLDSDLRPPPGATRPIGFAVIALGLAVWSGPLRRFVVEGRGTPAPVVPPDTLVVSGLYTRMRNPMYASYVVIALGEAILYRSVALAVYASILWATAHAYIVGSEEKALQRRFGAQYADYCARVDRWLPRRRGN
jgi:protein-S-isoprenylcysteine O-methyltransferase Ste14